MLSLPRHIICVISATLLWRAVCGGWLCSEALYMYVTSCALMSFARYHAAMAFAYYVYICMMMCVSICANAIVRRLWDCVLYACGLFMYTVYLGRTCLYDVMCLTLCLRVLSCVVLLHSLYICNAL